MTGEQTPSGEAAPALPAGQKPGVPKFSFEGNADVQRWLRKQSLADGEKNPAFAPTFLAHQRDRLWVLSSLAHFYEEDLIRDVLAVAKSGKEATVYCCEAAPGTGMDYAAAKVYRPRMFRSLKNDTVYREGRPQRDARGREVRDSRHLRNARKHQSGRAMQVSSWIEYEYQTQRLLYDAGGDVPRPLSQIGNAVLMEYIGSLGEPAPRLRDVTLTRAEAQPLFARILRNIELFLACDRIHGDLSAYNILYWRGVAVIIDFAQAVDPRYSFDLYELLVRDVERVCQYFARYGVAADAQEIASDLWMRYLQGDL